MSFQQGLSGLNGAAKSLDVIGNNIANSSTVGFKSSSTQFADVYASSLNGAGGITAGIGVRTAAIAQQFTQGNVEASNNPLDIAINGGGFFRIEQGGVVQYSRNGQFSLDREGFIVNAQGAKLTGYGIGSGGQIAPGVAVPLKIDSSDQPPKVTSKIEIQLQLDSRVDEPLKEGFDPADSDTYNKQVPISVYDTLGNPHTLSTYYVRTDDKKTWNVYASKDGTEIGALRAIGVAQGDATATSTRAALDAANKAVPQVANDIKTAAEAYADATADALEAGNVIVAPDTVAPISAENLAEIRAAAADVADAPGATVEQIDAAIAKAINMRPKPIGQLTFDTNGALVGNLSARTFNPDIPIVPATGAKLNMPVSIDFTGTTQHGAPMAENFLSQDGFKPGSLQRFTTGADGTILGQYSNGQTKALGQVVLANFTNPNGLEPLGNNAWAESTDSGIALMGTPGTGGMGGLQASATESSNVDLTAELVNMIVAQRAYQANAQTIKTQDSVLQTLVNLR